LEIVALEEGIAEDVISKLTAMGHKMSTHIKGFGRSMFGRGQVIARGKWPFNPVSPVNNRVYWAGSDPRADGAAVGY